MPHNQWTTSKLVSDVINQYNLHTKLVAITTDSGAEMLPAMRSFKDALNRYVAVSLTSDYQFDCVLHNINRAVVDAFALMKSEGKKRLQFLKICRLRIAMRHKFSQLTVMLGETYSHRNLPSINVETRWNSIFIMISQCYDRRIVFVSLCNFPEIKDRIQRQNITDIEWRILKSSMHFFSDNYNCTKIASKSVYATMLMQSLIFKRLLKLCDSTVLGTVLTGLTTPVVQKEAGAYNAKVLA